MEHTMDTTVIATDRPVRNYLLRVRRLLLSPAAFFREEAGAFTLSEAISFGIVSAWLAALFAFAIQTFNALLLAKVFDRWAQRMLSSDSDFSLLGMSADTFIWNAGFLVLAPFLLLFRVYLGSAVLFLFARLLIDEEHSPEAVTFRSVVRIQAFSLTGQWFSLVPVLGGLLAFIAHIVLLVTGVRERFRVSQRRAMVVVLAPYFFLVLTVLLCALLVVVAISQFPFQELLDIDLGQFGR